MLRVAPKVQNQGARGDSDGSICGLSGTGPQNRTPQLPPKPQITLATREPSTVHGPQPIADTADGRRQKSEADFIARAPGVRRVTQAVNGLSPQAFTIRIEARSDRKSNILKHSQ